jgi:hypothetical protein
MKPSGRFSKQAASRLRENSYYIDQQYRNSATLPQQPINYGGAVMLLTTTQITRMSGTTPGHGSGKIQKLTSGTYSDLTETAYPILNDSTSLIATGSYVLCVPAYGQWHVVYTSCANLS